MADEIAQLEGLSARLMPLEKLFEPRIPGQSNLPFTAVALAEQSGHWFIQRQHAFIPEGQYRAVEAPGFRESFKPLYRRLPAVEHPTGVAVLFIEDGISPLSKVPMHGTAVAATGAAAWEALTGEPHLRGILYNRQPYEDTIGSERKPLLSPPVPERFKLDLAEPALKAWLKKASYHVVSTSTVHFNDALKNPADRDAGEKRLTEYFGENAVYVQAADNNTSAAQELRHSAYRNHPDALLVGACQSVPATARPDAPRLMHMENYSSFGPDVVCETSPLSAQYLEGLRAYSKTYESMQGTSFSAPQAAVMVQALLERFAVSPENPHSVLTKEDVLLSLRQTAQPLHVREYLSAIAPENNKHLFENVPLGDHYASRIAGCGCIDMEAAWKQLERMEQAVLSGEAAMKPRQDVSAPLKLQPELDTDGHYRYQVDMKEALHADMIVIDAQVRNRLPFVMPGRMYLTGPQGGLLELFPSDNAHDQYRIARSSAFHGMKLAGTWTLLSTEALESAQINFRQSMAADHVAVTHKPDEAARFRQLYRQADLKTISYEDIDGRLLQVNADGKPAIACHDFSETGFPAGYLELRLLQLASDPAHKDHALALVSSGHPVFKAHEAELRAAIGEGNTGSVFALLAPNEKAQAALMEYAFQHNDNKEVFTSLAREVAPTVRDADGMPLFSRMVQEAQRDVIGNRDSQLTKLRAVMGVLHQKGLSILQPDAAKKTVMDYIVSSDIWTVLQQGVANEKRLAELKRQDEQFSGVVEEFVDKAGKAEVPAAGALDKALQGIDINQLRQMVLPATQELKPAIYPGNSPVPLLNPAQRR